MDVRNFLQYNDLDTNHSKIGLRTSAQGEVSVAVGVAEVLELMVGEETKAHMKGDRRLACSTTLQDMRIN